MNVERVKDFTKRFADLCLDDPTFGEVPSEFLSAMADPEVAPVLMAVARVFLLKKDDRGSDEEMEAEGAALFHSFFMEGLRRMFASDRPKTFALRDRKISDFTKIEEFGFDEDEAVHSMRLKIQGLLGIELSVEKTREIMESTIRDAMTFFEEQQS